MRAVAMLRSDQATEYPALRAIGDGPQALAERYPPMHDIVFTSGEGTLGNAGHCNALWTFLMPFSRFFGHYVSQHTRRSKRSFHRLGPTRGPTAPASSVSSAGCYSGSSSGCWPTHSPCAPSLSSSLARMGRASG